MTRPADAALATELGASYVGVVFARSPRQVSVDQAREVFDAAGPSVGHVAVFSDEPPEAIAKKANDSAATIVQLHGDAASESIELVRDNFDGKIWAVIPIDLNETFFPARAINLVGQADALLFDTRVAGRSGGTGRHFEWASVAPTIQRFAASTEVILAGGLNPENVGEAIQKIHPAVVDVSSGVEQSPGVKDPNRMKAFAEAVRSASIVGRINTPRGTSK